MELKELRAKTAKDLSKLLAQSREKLRSLRFSVGSKQLKNIREFREAKKLVARVLTLIKEQANKESSSVSNELPLKSKSEVENNHNPKE